MSDGSKGRKVFGGLIVLALLGGGYFVAWPALNWFRVEMAARESIDDMRLTRFPDVAKLLGVRQRLTEEGARRGFPGLQVELLLYERLVGPDVWWFLEAKVVAESRVFATEKRIETVWTEEDLEALGAGGCTVRRLPPAEAPPTPR